MNLLKLFKCGAAVLGGLSLVALLSGLSVAATTTKDEVSRPAAAFGEKVERQHYYLYACGYTRVGPNWHYLGSFDTAEDADAAAHAARGDDPNKRYSEIQVVAGSQLELPPAEKGNVEYIVAESGNFSYEAPRYRTLAAATAAAEQIRAKGKRFEVLYFLFGQQAPATAENPTRVSEPAANAEEAATKAKKEAAEKALRQYHIFGIVGCRSGMRLLGSYDRADEAFKAAEKARSNGGRELSVVTGTTGELPPANRACTFEVYGINRKCGGYNLTGSYRTLPDAVEAVLEIQKDANYSGFGIAYNYKAK
jgi:hypothetical protein